MKTVQFLLLVIAISFQSIAQKTIPHLKKNGNVTQLMVNNEPFLMIAGEIHNSSASTIEFMEPLFPKLKEMNLNSVFVTLAWEQFEPKEEEVVLFLSGRCMLQASGYIGVRVCNALISRQ